MSVEQRAFFVFQIGRFWVGSPRICIGYRRTSGRGWSKEIEAFSGLERRRMYHLAYERRYRNQTLDAVLSTHPARSPAKPAAARFKSVCCLDDREESFRRHLEEIDPACETFGVAGFYGVAMYYRGAADAHFVPLCPIVIKPQALRPRRGRLFARRHRIAAGPSTRRAFGQASASLHTGSRSAWAACSTSLLGQLAVRSAGGARAVPALDRPNCAACSAASCSRRR